MLRIIELEDITVLGIFYKNVLEKLVLPRTQFYFRTSVTPERALFF